MDAQHKGCQHKKHGHIESEAHGVTTSGAHGHTTQGVPTQQAAAGQQEHIDAEH